MKLIKQGMRPKEMVAATPTKDFDEKWGNPELFIAAGVSGHVGTRSRAGRDRLNEDQDMRHWVVAVASRWQCRYRCHSRRSRSPSLHSRHHRRERALLDHYCVTCHNQRAKTAA